MIDYFQEKKSQRATCRRCHKFITDKMRGVEETNGFGGFKEYRYYCLECCGKKIQEAKKELQNMEESLRLLFRKLKTKV